MRHILTQLHSLLKSCFSEFNKVAKHLILSASSEHNIEYCQEITWHCVCVRLTSTTPASCVHSAGALRLRCGRLACILRASCDYSAGVLRPASTARILHTTKIASAWTHSSCVFLSILKIQVYTHAFCSLACCGLNYLF